MEQEAVAQAQDDARFKQLDSQFKAEAVSPAWSANTELHVLDAFVSPESEAMGVPAPADPEVECRSSLCKIQATYDDDGQAADAAQMLAFDMGGQLPRAYRRVVDNGDGTSRLVVYAMR